MKLLITFLILSLQQSIQSQSINDFLDSYEGENSIPYIQPLADLFNTNLHSGIRERSRIDTGFYIHIGMMIMSSYPSNAQRTFKGKTDPDFEPEQTAVVPTIIGDINPVTVEGINGTAFVFPGGYNLKSLPMATPQVTIGGILNSEITARYFAFDLDEDLGKISLLGLGIRHGLNTYLHKLPVDLSVGYFYHNFQDDPYIKHQSNLISLHVGKTGKWWSAQLVIGYQNSNTKVKYSFIQNEEIKNIDLSINNSYTILGELSAAVHFSIFNIHTAINYSGPITGTIGLGLRL